LQPEIERELILKCRGGDARFYEPIVRAYEPQGLRVAMGMMGNPDDARDALQDAFVKAFQSLGRFDTEPGLRALVLPDPPEPVPGPPPVPPGPVPGGGGGRRDPGIPVRRRRRERATGATSAARPGASSGRRWSSSPKTSGRFSC
jgi:hypothetical protein